MSDESLDELHDFADRVGMPRRRFQGDHYDVPEEYRSRVVEAVRSRSRAASCCGGCGRQGCASVRQHGGRANINLPGGADER